MYEFLSAGMHVHHGCAMPEVQKRALESLGLELQIVVNSKDQTQILWKSSEVLLTAEASL